MRHFWVYFSVCFNSPLKDTRFICKRVPFWLEYVVVVYRLESIAIPFLNSCHLETEQHLTGFKNSEFFRFLAKYIYLR